MRKYLSIILLITIFTMFNSCGAFKNNAKTLKKVEIKTTESLKKESASSLDVESKGISTFSKKEYTENITINNEEPLEPIQLTATFKIDTSASLKGDTAIKLFDANDKNVSVVIYQNNRTRELTAKITSRKGSRDVPFSSLTINKGYKEESGTTDTTKRISSVASNKQDSVKQITKNLKEVENTKKSNNLILILSGVGLVGVGLLLYFKNKTKLTENGK